MILKLGQVHRSWYLWKCKAQWRSSSCNTKSSWYDLRCWLGVKKQLPIYHAKSETSERYYVFTYCLRQNPRVTDLATDSLIRTQTHCYKDSHNYNLSRESTSPTQANISKEERNKNIQEKWMTNTRSKPNTAKYIQTIVFQGKYPFVRHRYHDSIVLDLQPTCYLPKINAQCAEAKTRTLTNIQNNSAC